MRNRAKCKLCESIIESKHERDICECNCGEISVMGGDRLGCTAKDWKHFLRVDDNDNVIVPTIQESPPKPTRYDFLEALDEMIRRIEAMPPQAMTIAINHYDYVSLLILLSSLLRCDDKEAQTGGT